MDPRYRIGIPPSRIARYPATRRDGSRLMIVDPAAGRIGDAGFFGAIEGHLRPGDLLVLNDTRVFKARLEARRRSGGRVEILLLEDRGPVARALARPRSRLKTGEEIEFKDGSRARLSAKTEDGTVLLDFGAVDPGLLAARAGAVPLPPYLKRPAEEIDEERYQTVYAAEGASAAAPTAGLHFTADLLRRLEDAGVETVRVSLDVSYATFSPVRPGQERLHLERYRIGDAALSRLAAGRPGGRVVAVGTTVVRALASWAGTGRAEGWTDIFIRPGHAFRAVDALVTNFHLPESSLLMLVHAFAGDLIFEAYGRALDWGYRFFSYGDCMFLPGRASAPTGRVRVS